MKPRQYRPINEPQPDVSRDNYLDTYRPRFNRYFQGAESILREFRREVNWGWSSSDSVLARLVDLALADANADFTFDTRLDKPDGVAGTIGRSTVIPRADLFAVSTVKAGVRRR